MQQIVDRRKPKSTALRTRATPQPKAQDCAAKCVIEARHPRA